MSEEEFDRLFPGRHPLYRFAALQQALLFFPAAFNIGSYEIRRQEMAAFLANASHETGQFRIVREADEKKWPHYCDPGQIPCPEGRQYFGRGPIQLSWNYNYAAAGRALGLDLLHNPDLVEQDPLVAWSTALWFWTTQTGAGVMPSHYAIVSASGFRETIRSINGTLECGKSPGDIGHQQMRHRVELYLDIAGKLGVPPGDKLHC